MYTTEEFLKQFGAVEKDGVQIGQRVSSNLNSQTQDLLDFIFKAIFRVHEGGGWALRASAQVVANRSMRNFDTLLSFVNLQAQSFWLYVVPWGLQKLIEHVWEKYKAPIYICENGKATIFAHYQRIM